MRKINAEMPSSAQQNDLGIASNSSTGFGAMITGTGCTVAAGRMSSGCVLVILIAGLGAEMGLGTMLMRAVSFFGPGWTDGADGGEIGVVAARASALISSPGGFGSG